MKKISLIVFNILIVVFSFAQKQTFDVISYTVPAGWQQKQNDISVQLTATDNKTGAYIMAIITSATPSTGSAIDNFNSKWKAAIKDQIQLDDELTMQPSSNGNGWDIETGSAGYTDNGVKGNVSLLSATGGGKTVSVVIMLNSKQYEKDLETFLNSLELTNAGQSNANNTNTTAAANTDDISITGIWGQYQNESGTSGYDWREYYFNADGTYQFLQKNISYIYHNDIIFTYEKGTYKINGNQITISPLSGTVESWSKAGSDKAGKLLKTEKRPLEKTTYNFNFHHFSGIQKTSLVLQYNKTTVRDGPYTNNADFKNSWLYSKPFDPNKSAIELPSGTKIQMER